MILRHSQASLTGTILLHSARMCHPVSSSSSQKRHQTLSTSTLSFLKKCDLKGPCPVRSAVTILVEFLPRFKKLSLTGTLDADFSLFHASPLLQPSASTNLTILDNYLYKKKKVQIRTQL